MAIKFKNKFPEKIISGHNPDYEFWCMFDTKDAYELWKFLIEVDSPFAKRIAEELKQQLMNNFSVSQNIKNKVKEEN